MPSLLGRFFQAAVKLDPSQSDGPADGDAAFLTLDKKPPTHIRAKKSISSLLGHSLTGSSARVKCDTSPRNAEACLEAQLYPIYDSRNPKHNPKVPERTHGSSRRGSRSSKSPEKSLSRRESPPPRTLSTRGKSRLQGFTDTIRSKANLLHGTGERSSDEGLLQAADVPAQIPCSAKSVSSKKSVRFRSANSVISHEEPPSSPISIRNHSPPLLPMFDLSIEPMFGNDREPTDMGKTGRPPATVPDYLPFDRFAELASPEPCPGKLRPADSTQALLTPIPGTNLTMELEDPFDDSAALSEAYQSTHASCRAPNNTEESSSTDIEIGAATSGAVNPFDPDNSSSNSNIKDGACTDGSRTPSISLPRNTNITVAGNQVSASRFPSETQYDADTEPSDGIAKEKLHTDSMSAESSDSSNKRRARIYSINIQKQSLSNGSPNSSIDESESAPEHATIERSIREQPSRLTPNDLLLRPGQESSDSPIRSKSLFTASKDVRELLAVKSGNETGFRYPIDVLGEAKTNESGYRGQPQQVGACSFMEGVQGDSPSEIGDVSQDCLSTSHLPASISSISLPKASLHNVRFHGTDECESPLPDDYSESARDIAEEFAQRYSQDIVYPCSPGPPTNSPRIPSQVRAPSSQSIHSIKGRKHILRAFSVGQDGGMWSPFNEPLFAGAAYSMLRTSPETMAQLLCLEGVTRHLWKALHLPDATGPPRTHRPYTKLEVSDLFEALRGIAVATQEESMNARLTKSPSNYSFGSVSTCRRSSLGRIGPANDFGLRSHRRLPPSPLSTSEPVEAFPRTCDPFQVDSSWFKSVESSPEIFAVDRTRSPRVARDLDLETDIQRSVSNLSDLQLPAAKHEELGLSLPQRELSETEKEESDEKNGKTRGSFSGDSHRELSSLGENRPKSLLELVMSARQASSTESLQAELLFDSIVRP